MTLERWISQQKYNWWYGRCNLYGKYLEFNKPNKSLLKHHPLSVQAGSFFVGNTGQKWVILKDVLPNFCSVVSQKTVYWQPECPLKGWFIVRRQTIGRLSSDHCVKVHADSTLGDPSADGRPTVIAEYCYNYKLSTMRYRSVAYRPMIVWWSADEL